MQLQFKKQQTICAIMLCFSAIFVPLTSQAVSVKEVPNPRRINNTWVTDNANILSDITEVQLNQIISDLETKNSSEIAVVTVTDTKPSVTPKAFATELFNFWGIGKKGKNNGVLLLISSGERRVQIETGSGIQSILPDAKTVRIIETDITPRFKQQDFNGGTLAGTKALVNVLQTPIANVQSQTALPFAPLVPSQGVKPSPIPSQSPVISNSTSTGEDSSNPIYGLLWFLLIPFLVLIIVLIVCLIILKMFLGLFSRKFASLRHRYPRNYSSNTPSYRSNNRNYSSSNNHNYCGAGGDYTINNIDYSSSSSSDDCGGDYSSSSSDCAGSFGGGSSSGGGGGGDYSSSSSSDYSCSSSDYSSSSSSSSDSSGGGGGGDW